jgi:hypothetical protein
MDELYKKELRDEDLYVHRGLQLDMYIDYMQKTLGAGGSQINRKRKLQDS